MAKSSNSILESHVWNPLKFLAKLGAFLAVGAHLLIHHGAAAQTAGAPAPAPAPPAPQPPVSPAQATPVISHAPAKVVAPKGIGHGISRGLI